MTIQKKLFISHFLVVLLVCGGVGTYFYFSVVQNLMSKLRVHVENYAPMVKQCLDASQLDQIRTPEDTKSDVYQKYLERLRNFKFSNRYVDALYVLRREGNRAVYVIDQNESPQDQKQPGELYAKLTPALQEGFSQLYVDKRIRIDDAWGPRLTGYVPLRGGEHEYLVGLDINAKEEQSKIQQIRISGGISIAVSILFALLFSRAISSRMITPIRMLISRCSAIAEGKLDERLEVNTTDELNDLVEAFNTMSGHLSDSNARRDVAEAELKKTLDELEERVQERTKDLKEANSQLLTEIAERKRAEKALAEAARTDALTGLLNRRAMLERLNEEVENFHKHHKPFALLLCDIDFFKKVNDTYGHPEGDVVIREISDALKRTLRAQDVVARWGGEEFLMMMTGSDLAAAAAMGEQVREAIRGRIYPPSNPDHHITLSIGVSAYSSDARIEECIKAADDALYTAKRQGRDRVITSDNAEEMNP